jgi:uncharacterized cupredoxin-like copper-binding protein
MFARIHGSLGALAVVAALTLIGSACGGDNDESGGSNTVKVTQKDFSIALDRSTVDHGDITFDIHNDGPSTHEFVVFKTDLADDNLPVNSDEGIVDEEGEGLASVDEQEDIENGADAELAVTLDAGSYVVICNLAGHYEQGMHATLTVT